MRQKILNTKVKNFNTLSKPERDHVLYITENFLKSNPIIRIGKTEFIPYTDDFWTITLNEMITLKTFIENQDFIEVLKMVYELDVDDINKLNVFNCFSAYKFVVDEIKAIQKIEEERLGSKPNAKAVAAGIENFSEYGHYNTIRRLTKGDKTKESYYLNLPFNEIFIELCYQSTEYNYQKKLYKA